MFEEVLSETFSVFFKNIGYYAIIALVITLPIGLLGFGTLYWSMGDMISMQSDMMQMAKDQDQNQSDPEAMQKDMLSKFMKVLPAMIAKMAGAYIILLVLALIGLMTHISTIIVTNDYYNRQPFNLSSVLLRALKKLPGLMVIALLMGIACFVGLLFFIIPGIFLAVKFSLSLPIYVVEDIGIFDSIERSFSLTSNIFWPIIGTTFIFGVMATVLMWVVSIAFNVVTIFSQDMMLIYAGQSLAKWLATFIYFLIYISMYLYYIKATGSMSMKGKLEPEWEAPKPEFPAY